jgi:HEAT repeat protein
MAQSIFYSLSSWLAHAHPGAGSGREIRMAGTVKRWGCGSPEFSTQYENIDMSSRNESRAPSIMAIVAIVACTLLIMEAAPRRGLAAQDPPEGRFNPVTGRPATRPSFVRRSTKQGILDLEDAIARAELVIVVRVVDLTETKIVHGGKTEVLTQQFRFEPVRTLNGIFARDALLLTGQDLGIHQFAARAERLDRGQMLLLLLGRQGPGYFNCNTAESLEQSIPRLHDNADPLLPAVEALIAVSQERDRATKVTTLLAALRQAKDRDAVPLLISLRRRAVLAAQTPDSAAIVSRFLSDAPPEVREVAARTLASLLGSDYLQQGELRDRAVQAIVAALDASGSDVGLRVAAFDALGAAGEAARRAEPALAWLRADRAGATFAEHAARLRAIARSGRVDQGEAVAAFLDQLPLDAPDGVQLAAGRALVALDPRGAAGRLTNRLATKSDAGLEIASEIALIGELTREVAAPALLEAFPRVEGHAERLAFATACVKVADPGLVGALGALLDPRYHDVRWQATEALMRIDTDEAASVLWPHLSQEADLLRKLQLAGFLGRHGFRGGYPYAIEHMSAPQLLDAAVEALAAIRDPKAVPELRKIWENSNDVGWNAAAIRALGRLGQADIAPRLLELARDRRSPLVVPALIALGDLQEARALPIVLDGLGSRNDEVVVAAVRAARKLLAAPEARSDEVRDRLAALAADTEASEAVRAEALEALVSLNDPRLSTTLVAAARDGGLEGSQLMQRIEELLAERKERLN